ncbi:MAG TPA: hypothetical protein VIX89_01710 [Bryobacteraceae bacterium]
MQDLRSRCSWLMLALAGGLGMGQSRVSAPVAGLVFDGSLQTLRPINGIVGTARLGTPLDLGFQAGLAVVSPRQDYTLATDAASGEMRLLRFRPDGISAAGISGAMNSPDRFVLSPAGRSAALYSASSARIQVIRGLLQAPGPAVEMAGWPGSLTALAVNDDGSFGLAAFFDGSAGMLVRFSERGAMPVWTGGRVPAIVFLPNGRDAVAADATANVVFLIRNVADAPETVPLAGASDGIDGPVAVAASRDGLRVFAASAGSHSVVVIDLAGGQRTRLDCDCMPAGLTPLAADVFQLTGIPGDTLWLLDATPAGSRLVFVAREKAGNAR